MPVHSPSVRRTAPPLGRRLLGALLLVLAGALAAAPAAAQPERPLPAVSDTLWRIQLADGSTIIGRVVAAEAGRITVETEAGVRVEIGSAQLRGIRPAGRRVIDGEEWMDDPNHSRLLFGPTARPVGGGAGYFGVFELFFPYLAFGVTDAVTIAAGTAVGPEITGKVFYLAPKLTLVNREGFAAAVGALAFFLTEDLDEGSTGLLYGVGTVGRPDASASFGVGFPFYTAGDDPIASNPVVMLGGEMRTGRMTKLLTENYLIPTEGFGVASVGIRFFGERLSADAGIGLGVGEDGVFCCLPLVNFVYAFGRR